MMENLKISEFISNAQTIRIFCSTLIKKQLKGDAGAAAVPSLVLENTSFCNSACLFCPNKTMRRGSGHMGMDVFKKVVDDFIALGGFEITFGPCIGEPLLDPYLMERLRYIKKFPQLHSVGLITNLQELHKYKLDEFFEARLTFMIISVILSGRDSFLKFFGNDAYEQTLCNLISLLNENNKRHNPITLDLYIRPTEQSDEEVLSHHDFKLINDLMHGALTGKIKTRLLGDNWCGAVQLPVYVHQLPLLPRFYNPCRWLYKFIRVFWDGRVSMCSCRDFEASIDLSLGSIQEHSLSDLWRGEKLSLLRTNWLRKNSIPAICKSCTIYYF